MIHTALDSHIPSRPEISGVYEAESSILGFSMLCTSDFAKKRESQKVSCFNDESGEVRQIVSVVAFLREYRKLIKQHFMHPLYHH